MKRACSAWPRQREWRGRISSVTEFAIHDAANRLVEIRSGSATGALRTVAHHDADGQLVRLCDIRTGGTLSGTGASCTATGAGARQLALTWDASGRLSQAVVNGTTHSYTYDHADRRLSKTVAGATTHYAYDGDDLYARFTSGWSAPSSVTVHGGGVDEPLWELTGATSGPSANARYYRADGLGMVALQSEVLATTGLSVDTDFCTIKQMKTTLDINDQLLADARSLALQQRTTLTRLIEEGLQLRLRAQARAVPPVKVRLPVFSGKAGLVPGVDALSNKGLLRALGDDA
ncbi:MAG: hypothetical protein ACK515_09060 [bacterium]|nr:type II toxin-antitoxin system VapB family antitoxin [Betaproteobacteria bacterium]